MADEDNAALHRKAERLLRGESVEMQQARALVELEELEAEERAEEELPRLEAEERAERPHAERRDRQWAHRTAADEYDALADKLSSSVAGYRSSAAAVVNGHRGKRIPSDRFSEVRKDTAALIAQDRAARDLRALAKRERDAFNAYVVAEPGPYDAGSPHSWVRDVLALRGQEVQSTAGSPMNVEAVRERLSNHGEDIHDAIRKGSKFGKRAVEIKHEQERCEDEVQHRRKVKDARIAELRAFGSGGGATAAAPGEAASFVPPAILLKAWAGFRTPFASFAGQCKQEDMPAYGLNVYVPHMTGAMEVTSQTEGSAPAEKAPTAGLIKGAVVNKAGQVEVSQQFLDRVGPGIAGDQVLFAQLKMEIDTAVDLYALEAALKEAQIVNNSTGTFSFGESSGGVGGFTGDLRKGKNLVATTAGTRLKATHMFAPSKFVNYIEAWGTTIGGPVWSPALDDYRLPIKSEGDAQGEGYTGYLLSQLAVFADDNIPLYGTGSFFQVLVADPATVLLFRSPPVFYAYPETYSTTLDAALGARVYTACVPRWPEGAASLTGGMYHSTLFA